MAVVARQRVREDPVVRRRQIVDEAFRVIGRHGFNGFTVQLLAEKCGLSNAGLLYYFGSKDALLIALLDEFERQETEMIAPLVATAQERVELTQDALAVRLGLLRRIVERSAERPELNRFSMTLQSEALDPSHPAHDWFGKRQDLALALFESMVTGFVRDPATTARLLYAQMNGLEQQWLRAPEHFDLLSAWDEGVRCLVRADISNSGVGEKA